MAQVRLADTDGRCMRSLVQLHCQHRLAQNNKLSLPHVAARGPGEC